MLFLVNEFAEVSVDADSLSDIGSPVQSVVGGSLFCECKAAEFVRVMKETVLEEHSRDPFRAVIIETSGIADPEAIGRVMRDFGLDEHFQVEMVVSITAAKSFLKLVDNLANIAAQIRTSNLVVLNKTDLSGEAELLDVERRVRELNPEAEVVRAEYCRFPFEWISRSGELPNAPLAVECNPYTTETVSLPGIVSRKGLQDWLDSLPPSILRVKGSVQTDEGWVHVEKSMEGLEVSEGDAVDTPSLVLIAHDDDEEELKQIAPPERRG